MAKRIDLVGQRFGRLVVLRFNHSKNNKSYWECLCDCGNKSIVSTSDLKSKNTISCGCYKRECIIERMAKDYSGMKFNRVTLLERIPPTKQNRHTMYKCKCDCGKEFIVRGSAVTMGNTKSCGCYAQELKTGPKYKLRKTNNYEICGDVTYVLFDNTDKKAIIDTEDLNKIKDYKWRINPSGYVVACSRIKGESQLNLHRIATNNNSNLPTDHINRNKLDNRKCNLRICESIVNANNLGLSPINTTGHRNVVRNSKSGKLVVNFIHMGKTYYCGEFYTMEEALIARNKKYKEVGRPIED